VGCESIDLEGEGEMKLDTKAQLVCAAVIAAAVTSAVVTWLVFGYLHAGPRVDVKRRWPQMPDYALDILMHRWTAGADFDSPDDTLELRKAKRNLRALNEEHAASMPADQASRAKLKKMLTYFGDKKDELDIWIECLSGARRFKGTTPRQVLDGALATMEALGIRPERKQSLRHFVSLYQNFREDDHLDHEGGVAMIIRLRKFGN
jgi:hypothetical protein